MAGLLYGSGLRLMECARPRVRGGDFGYHLPYAPGRKQQNAASGWVRPWVFPAGEVPRGPRAGEVRRHHASADPL